MAETRHYAVVLNAIDRDRARQAEQGGAHHRFAIALQEIGIRERRKRACKARRHSVGGTRRSLRDKPLRLLQSVHPYPLPKLPLYAQPYRSLRAG